MQKLRIKLKHLLLLIIGLAMIFTLPFVLKDQIFLAFAEQSPVKVQNAFLNKLIYDNPESSLAVNAALQKYDNYLKDLNWSFMDDWIMIDQDGSASGSKIVYMNDVEKINKELAVIESYHQEDKNMDKLKTMVALLNWCADNSQEADRLLDQIIANKNSESAELARIYKSTMLIMLGNISEGQDLLKSAPFSKYTSLARAVDIYAQRLQGQSVPVIESTEMQQLKKLLQIHDNESAIYGFNDFFTDCISSPDLLSIAEIRPGNNKLDGRLSIDGKPLHHVIVGIKPNADNGCCSPVQHNRVLDYTITDSEGRYTLDGIGNGEFRLVMFIPGQRISGYYLPLNFQERSFTLSGETEHNLDFNFVPVLKAEQPRISKDKIEFNWEEYPGCYSYAIQGGLVMRSEDGSIAGTVQYINIREIPDNHYTADLIKLHDSGTKVLSWSDKGIVPEYLFEDFYLGGEYAFSVYAYDRDGNILNSSSGVLAGSTMPLFQVEGMELTKADKMLLERQYEQSRQQYASDLADNPDDRHARIMLDKLNRFKEKNYYIREDKSSSGEPLRDKPCQDY